MALRDYKRAFIHADDTLRHAIEAIEAGAIQIALVVDEAGRLLGAVTDGDIRRGILRGIGLDQPVVDVMNTHPMTAQLGMSPQDLLALMTARSVKQIPLVDGEGRVVGLERLDTLLRGPAIKENPVIILAGGLGTRLKPLTTHTPKPLLEVGGRPVLELMLNLLIAHGFHRVFISVNHLGEKIEDYFGDGRHHGVSIQYLREEQPLGTAGPLSLLPRPQELPCVVVNGDLLTQVNFDHMLEFHRGGGYQLTIGVKEYPFQLPFGVVVTQGESVVEFQEKPVETKFINAGMYVLAPEVIEMVPGGTDYDMNQLIENVIRLPEHRVGAFVVHEYWMDIGTDATYQQAETDYRVHFAH